MALKHYLYRQFAADGSLLYVGACRSPERRMVRHRATTDWYAQIAKVETVEFESREAALAAERKAIAEEKPAFNVTYQADGGAAALAARQGFHKSRVVDHGSCYQIGQVYIGKSQAGAGAAVGAIRMLRRRRRALDLCDGPVSGFHDRLAAAAVPFTPPVLPKKRPKIVAGAALPG